MASKPPPIPRKPEAATVPVSVRLPAELVERLDAYAKKQFATRTDALGHLLGWALDQAEAK